ncbi:MAG: MutS-related protein [Steroidobacteraceae bacterium]
MNFVLPGLRAAIAAILDWFFPRRRALREIREAWGKPGKKDAWLADRYFRLTNSGDDLSHVDDRTWNDLEFPRIFSVLDTTITRPGSQCLFRMLRTYATDADHSGIVHESLQALRCDRELRERTQLLLTALNADSAANVIDALFEPRLEALKHPRLTVVWSLVSVGLLAGIAASAIPLMLVIPILAVNVAVITRTGLRRYRLTETLRALRRMLAVADRLSHLYSDSPIPQLAALAADRPGRARARRAFRLVGALDRMSPLGLDTWLNLLFLAEWLVYLYTIDRVAAVRAELRTAYDLVGSLDAAIAMASLLERTRTWCRPVIGPERVLEIENGCHPLVAEPVANSMTLRQRSALISGSNMAGKTTFIKMMAINVIFGRTVGICLAAKATIPAAAVMACIRSDQSVESGKSRYFAEAEAILSFLRSGTRSTLVVLDEPFSGTNTTERIAAAKSVLDVLSEHSLVLATTHDVELQDLLRDRFDMYHFTENPELRSFFDYHLRTGPCTERNALRLLARLGFPPQVISEADAFIAERNRSKT